MKFGWMTLSRSPSAAEDLARVHQQLERGVLAEAMGFDYLWLTEHNFTGECAYADPIPFAGALAARTSTAGIGFAVIQMALHHPVRLAIQLAASVWRFLDVAESQAQAEDDVHEATLHYRRHMHHVRDAHNPADLPSLRLFGERVRPAFGEA